MNKINTHRQLDRQTDRQTNLLHLLGINLLAIYIHTYIRAQCVI